VSAPEALLVNNREAAAMLGIGVTTLYGLVRAGHLHIVRLGRAARFHTGELKVLADRLLEEAQL
jgi:excisionase family DNA binding protein